MNVAVLTDSTSDLQPERVRELGAEVVPLYVNFRGRVLKDYLEITTPDVFRGVSEGAGMPSTSQPTPADFEAAYARLLEGADHVLSIHISSKLSGTLGSASLAAGSFPGKVTVFDSLAASGSLSMLVERAVQSLRSGEDLGGVLAVLGRAREALTIRFSVGSLEYLRKNGRIGGAQALIGGLLNIKPILALVDGRVEAAGRARGAQKALADMVEALRGYTAKHGPSRAAYLYTDGPESVAPLQAAGRELGLEEFGLYRVGPVIAAHVGPGTYGVCLEPLEV